MKVLFVSTKDVKQRSIIDGSLDDDKIIQWIEMAQEKHVQTYLGSRLYNKIIELIDNDTISDSGNEDYLYLLTTYVRPMLIWFSQVEYLPYSNFTVNNKGTFKNTSESGEFADQDEIAYLVKNCSNNAQWYTDRFIDYMCNNSSKYPEYNQNRNDDLYPDKDPNFNVGWVI